MQNNLFLEYYKISELCMTFNTCNMPKLLFPTPDDLVFYCCAKTPWKENDYWACSFRG